MYVLFNKLRSVVMRLFSFDDKLRHNNLKVAAKPRAARISEFENDANSSSVNIFPVFFQLTT